MKSIFTIAAALVLSGCNATMTPEQQQQFMNGMMMMEMSRPRPMYPTQQYQKPLNCQTRNVMGTLYTDCW